MVFPDLLIFDIIYVAVDPILSAKYAQFFPACLENGWFVSWSKLADWNIDSGPFFVARYIKVLNRVAQIAIHVGAKNVDETLIEAAAWMWLFTFIHRGHNGPLVLLNIIKLAFVTARLFQGAGHHKSFWVDSADWVMQSCKPTFQTILPAELPTVLAFAIIFGAAVSNENLVTIIHVARNNEFVALVELAVAAKHENSIM